MNQQALRLDTPDTADFDSFYPGPNARLVAQLRDWALEDESGQIFVVGPTASGKTHLAQAACRAAWDSGRRAAYLSLAQLGDLAGGADGLPLAGLVAVDELDALNPDAELAMMRLIDASRAAGGRLLFASRQWPDQLALSIPDLRSRLTWGAVFELKLLGDEDLAQMLHTRCRLRGVEMAPAAIEFLIRRVRRDPGSLLAAFDAAYARAVAEGRRLTVPLLRAVLGGGAPRAS